MIPIVTRYMVCALCMAIAAPVLATGASGDRGVYISQVGASMRADIDQTNADSYVSVRQQGDSNGATLTQAGEHAQYLVVEQNGSLNNARVAQTAAPGGASAGSIEQMGDENAVILNQFAQPGSLNGAVLAQQGNGNSMQLDQNGSGNSATLAQNGDNNAMTAVQNGNANQLQWTQNGSGLSDLGITQSGGQAISVTQSNGGF